MGDVVVDSWHTFESLGPSGGYLIVCVLELGRIILLFSVNAPGGTGGPNTLSLLVSEAVTSAGTLLPTFGRQWTAMNCRICSYYALQVQEHQEDRGRVPV